MFIIWKTFTKKTKAIIILFLLVLISILYLSARVLYFKNKYINEQLEVVKELKEWKSSIELKQVDINLDNKKTAEDSKKKTINIKQKLKSDEEAIDNRDITDYELDEFLSRY